MYLCTMCTMLYTKSKRNNLTNPVTNNRVAICKIKLAAPYRGQAEYQLCRLNTSEESRALKSCGPYMVIRSYRSIYDTLSSCSGLTVYSVADVCQLADVQPSRGKRLMCPREASQALACMLIFLYCLKYNYKIILIFYDTLSLYVMSILYK